MRRNWLEWVILVASVVAILALVGYLGIQLVNDRAPTYIAIEARPAEASRTSAGWTVPVVVRNGGGEPAATVVIEATATVGVSEEVTELTADLVPAHSEIDLVVAFSDQPDGEIAFRLVGYESP